MLREIEQLAVISIPILCIFAFSQHSRHILYQFAVLIVPQYISILVPSLIPFMVACLILIVLSRIPKEEGRKGQKIEPRTFFDLARFLTITQTTVCIFLCDFVFWDPRFSKNDGYAIGLMDLGVGCFMFNGGVVSCKVARRKMAKSAVLLFLLGLLRLLAVGAFKLQVNPKEYGTHWNFYFTLSAVSLLYILLSPLLSRGPHSKLLLGVALVAGYELASPQVSDLIFRAGRSNILLGNKEGLFSLIPFLGFFLVLSHAGDSILEKNLKRAIRNLGTLWCINAAVCVAARTYSHASRRMCNLAYLSWILFIQFTFIWLFMQAAYRCPHLISNTAFFRHCSQNMLHIFLFSNLLVLVFKLCFDLGSMSYLSGNALNLVYLALNFIALPKALGLGQGSAQKNID